MPTPVLVTGGAGFIGSHLVDALVAEGHAVRVVDDLSTGFRKNIAQHGAKVELLEGDLSRMEVARAACRGIEVVYHEAAINSVPRSLDNPFLTQQAGEMATLRLLEACVEQRVRRLVYAGSSSIYGASPQQPRVETIVPEPLSPYAASKLACESYVRAYAYCRALETITLRYFNVFGPRQNPHSPYSAVIALFLERMRQGRAPHVHGDGTQARDFTYVQNVVQANLLALRAALPTRGIACNIGCGGRVSVNQVVAALNAALGSRIQPTYGPPRAGDVRESMADISRARELLGFAPRVSFEEGIERLVKAEASGQVA